MVALLLHVAVRRDVALYKLCESMVHDPMPTEFGHPRQLTDVEKHASPDAGDSLSAAIVTGPFSHSERRPRRSGLPACRVCRRKAWAVRIPDHDPAGKPEHFAMVGHKIGIRVRPCRPHFQAGTLERCTR